MSRSMLWPVGSAWPVIEVVVGATAPGRLAVIPEMTAISLQRVMFPGRPGRPWPLHSILTEGPAGLSLQVTQQMYLAGKGEGGAN
jgi:hypothetical protein